MKIVNIGWIYTLAAILPGNKLTLATHRASFDYLGILVGKISFPEQRCARYAYMLRYATLCYMYFTSSSTLDRQIPSQ